MIVEQKEEEEEIKADEDLSTNEKKEKVTLCRFLF